MIGKEELIPIKGRVSEWCNISKTLLDQFYEFKNQSLEIVVTSGSYLLDKSVKAFTKVIMKNTKKYIFSFPYSWTQQIEIEDHTLDPWNNMNRAQLL